MNRTNGAVDGEQRMTSVEIAELTGKNHFDVLRAIRKMEPAWEKVTECKFALRSKTIVQRVFSIQKCIKRTPPGSFAGTERTSIKYDF